MAIRKLSKRMTGNEEQEGDASGEDMRHMHSIRALAEEIDLPVEEVAAAYEDVLDELEGNARITDYLPILVSKRVKQLYRGHE